MSRNFRWIRPPTQAWSSQRYIVALDNAVAGVLTTWAPTIEADAKLHARWTDRTGNARQTLAAIAYRRQPHLHALILRQWMSYGKWLELRWGGRYAIVLPTLQVYYEDIWRSAKGLVE